MTADFRSLLSKPLDEIKRPPPLPAGTYYGIISGHEFGESKNKKTPYVRFNFTLTGPGKDVDTAALDGVDLTKRTPRRDFYLTEDAFYRAKDFLESVGVNVTGRSLGECIPEAANARVIIDIIQRNSDDGKDIFNDVADVRGQE